MVGAYAPILLLVTLLPIGASRHRPLLHRTARGPAAPGPTLASQADCKAAGAALARRGPTHRVALVLRGESFRGSPLDKVYDSKQYGVAKRTTCFDEEAYHRQVDVASNFLKTMDEMRLDGYTVDLFGLTFDCVNGKDYARRLPEIYNQSFLKFTVLSEEVRRKSVQVTSIQRGLGMVAGQMEEAGVVYDRVYILRWDNMYSCEHFRLLDDVGVAGNGHSLSRTGSADVVLMVTTAYLPCFVDFARLPYVSGKRHDWDRCCSVFHCGGGNCNFCMENFLRTVYGRGLDKYVPITAMSCPRQRRGALPEPLIPPHEDWLPESDDPDLCHPAGEGNEG